MRTRKVEAEGTQAARSLYLTHRQQGDNEGSSAREVSADLLRGPFQAFGTTGCEFHRGGGFSASTHKNAWHVAHIQ